jgi:phospholipid/cholesterol/gamma-HCH transport system substrate-binding protein
MKFYKESKIGLIIAIAIAMVIWGLNFLKGRNIFTSSSQYYAVFDNVGGLKKSSTVSTNGYTIGLVSDIFFQKNNVNKIVVEILVEKQFKIPKNTVVEIYGTDLMGSKAVNLLLGDSTVYASENDTLLSRFEGDLNTLVSKKLMPLKDKAENLIVSIDSVITSIRKTLTPETQQNIRHAIAALEGLIITEKQKISSILDNFESISKNFENSNQSITNLATNLSSISDSLAAANLKKTIEKANSAMTQADEILTKINSGKGSFGLLVNNDSLYLNLNRTIQDLDTLLVDLNKHPKRYVHLSIFGSKDKKSRK